MQQALKVTPRAVASAGGLRAIPADEVLAQERRMAEARRQQQEVFVGSLAKHVRRQWRYARDAKRNGVHSVETRMLKSLRARRGEYDPDKKAAIREVGGSDVFAMITATKCRAASAWLKDLIRGKGLDSIWEIAPTPLPDLPPHINDQMVAAAGKVINEATMAGMPPSEEDVQELLRRMRDKALLMGQEAAQRMADRMSLKIEDQLIEGGFYDELERFLDDLVTMPGAVFKGPVIRRHRRLVWGEAPDGTPVPVVEEKLTEEFKRVDPLKFFPSPSSEEIPDGFTIEQHELLRSDLRAMIGVEGYDQGAIELVLDEHGRGGLQDWLINDIEIETAKGNYHAWQNPDDLIDALQYWGSVQGKMLLEWGMSPDTIPDPLEEYPVEIWLIGNYVIKASLNPDPLGKKPYFKTCYEKVPGSFWGNSVADLVREPEAVCNAAARGIVNNMAMASGPQVAVNVDRLAGGEELSTLEPWRIWQFTNDPMSTGQGQRMIDFFQPKSNVDQLMKIFDRFSDMADEYSGIPKYLTGQTTGGAGRTASGLSMLISNAGKGIKQVVSNMDNDIIEPLLEKLYAHNMLYATDPDLKGDVQVRARGANSLINRETAAVRRAEFLATTANPFDLEIMGVEGRANILREQGTDLGMISNPVPTTEELRSKLQAKQQAEQMLAQQQQQQGTPAKPGGPSQSGQSLMDGAPVTDNFSPPRQ